MDNASDYGSEDSRFESWRARFLKMNGRVCILLSWRYRFKEEVRLMLPVLSPVAQMVIEIKNAEKFTSRTLNGRVCSYSA